MDKTWRAVYLRFAIEFLDSHLSLLPVNQHSHAGTYCSSSTVKSNRCLIVDFLLHVININYKFWDNYTDLLNIFSVLYFVTVIVPTGQCGQGLLLSGFKNRSLKVVAQHAVVFLTITAVHLPSVNSNSLFVLILGYMLCAAIRPLQSVKIEVSIINVAHMPTIDVFLLCFKLKY
jgi:hypothetical protein